MLRAAGTRTSIRQWVVSILLVAFTSRLAGNVAGGAVVDEDSLGLGYGLPGTTQTVSGYDTELGADAMCWRSQGSLLGAESSGGSTVSFPNPLIKDFRLNGSIKLLNKCPVGNALVAHPPSCIDNTASTAIEGERLRTGQWRNFTVSVKLNTTSLTEDGTAIADRFFTSDYGPKIAIQIMACRTEVSGFCSPFKHEESNARLAAMGIKQKLSQGDSHGGSHVHSGYKLIELRPEDGPIYEFNIEIPMIVNDPGLYFPIVAAQLFFRDIFSIDTRYDMANAMPPEQRLLRYQEPPTILSVPRTVRIVSHCAIGGVSAVICFLLLQCIWHRDHQILKLTQGYFIIVFLIAALGLTLSSFLYEPRNDVYCRYGPPMVLIFAQLLYAVSLCRLWRINAVISPLLVQTLRQRENDTLLKRATAWLRGAARNDKTKNLRKTVTWHDMAYRIGALTLPQVIIQVLNLVIDAPHKGIEFNDDESVGREYCRGSTNGLLGKIVFGLLILTLLGFAHHTRSLPSLFNETRDIFDSTLATLVIVILGGGVKVVSNGSPTTSPAVAYLVEVSLALCCALNTSTRIVLPKLRKIWRGETVLVSKLMSDHKNAVMKDDLLYRTRQRKRARHEGADAQSTAFATSLGTASSIDAGLSCSTSFGHFKDGDSEQDLHQSERRIILRQDEAPAHQLTLKLINMQSCLKDINERIMAGMVVPMEDWISLRRLSSCLASTFTKDVEFAWEVPDVTTRYRPRNARRSSECSWSHQVSLFSELHNEDSELQDDGGTAETGSDL